MTCAHNHSEKDHRSRLSCKFPSSLAAGHAGSIFGAAVSAGAPHLVATASDDETVRLWEDAELEGVYRQIASMATADSAMCVSFSANGSLLAAGDLLTSAVVACYTAPVRHRRALQMFHGALRHLLRMLR